MQRERKLRVTAKPTSRLLSPQRRILATEWRSGSATTARGFKRTRRKRCSIPSLRPNRRAKVPVLASPSATTSLSSSTAAQSRSIHSRASSPRSGLSCRALLRSFEVGQHAKAGGGNRRAPGAVRDAVSCTGGFGQRPAYTSRHDRHLDVRLQCATEQIKPIHYLRTVSARQPDAHGAHRRARRPSNGSGHGG